MNNIFFRIGTCIRHWLTSWNTTGEGIHSPYLFEYVRFVLRDRNCFYCFPDIERRRGLLLACDDELEVTDYGSAGSPSGMLIRRRVKDIAKNHLETPAVGQMLFRTVNWLGQKEKHPLEILELGTSLGITTAYLASPDSRNHVVTFEGSGELLRVAKGVWRALRLENIEWREGNIDDTLPDYADGDDSDTAHKKIDLAYLDANHTYEATIRYARLLLPKLADKGILVLDDIHYSKGMEKAWNELKKDERVTTTIDLYHAGMLFVDPHFLKRHYKIIFS